MGNPKLFISSFSPSFCFFRAYRNGVSRLSGELSALYLARGSSIGVVREGYYLDFLFQPNRSIGEARLTGEQSTLFLFLRISFHFAWFIARQWLWISLVRNDHTITNLIVIPLLLQAGAVLLVRYIFQCSVFPKPQISKFCSQICSRNNVEFL